MTKPTKVLGTRIPIPTRLKQKVKHFKEDIDIKDPEIPLITDNEEFRERSINDDTFLERSNNDETFDDWNQLYHISGKI